MYWASRQFNSSGGWLNPPTVFGFNFATNNVDFQLALDSEEFNLHAPAGNGSFYTTGLTSNGDLYFHIKVTQYYSDGTDGYPEGTFVEDWHTVKLPLVT